MLKLPEVLARVPVPTMEQLNRKTKLHDGGLRIGGDWSIVRASFGQSEGYRGVEDDNDLAHLVIRDDQIGQLYVIQPVSFMLRGADGGAYYEVAMICRPMADPAPVSTATAGES